MHVIVGHLGHLLLVLKDYCRTLCLTFWGKTSDIGVETSDMSGCPTVFQKHCGWGKKLPVGRSGFFVFPNFNFFKLECTGGKVKKNDFLFEDGLNGSSSAARIRQDLGHLELSDPVYEIKGAPCTRRAQGNTKKNVCFLSTGWEYIRSPGRPENLFFSRNLFFCHSPLVISNIRVKPV